VPLFMASLLGAKVLVEYKAILVSDFALEDSCLWRTKLVLLLRGI
jgi:hypothetical protein